MNISRSISIAFVSACIAACSAAPSKPAASAKPATAMPTSAIADISGKWILTVQSPQGAVDADMLTIQTGKDIKGTMDSPMGSVDYTGSVNGKEVKFTYSLEKFGAPAGTNFDYVGTVDGATMKGTATFSTFGAGEWSAKRQ